MVSSYRGDGKSFQVRIQVFAGWGVGGADETLLIDNVSIATIPEPATLLVWSLLAALGFALGWQRRK